MEARAGFINIFGLNNLFSLGNLETYVGTPMYMAPDIVNCSTTINLSKESVCTEIVKEGKVRNSEEGWCGLCFSNFLIHSHLCFKCSWHIKFQK